VLPTELHRAGRLGRRPPVIDGRPYALPFAGDGAAKPVVRQLIEALACGRLDIGDPNQSRHLEASAIRVIRLLRSGNSPRTVLDALADLA